MASDTKNVKIGVCKVIFDGVDLGYTKGGVEVSVKTETHQVNIDQFGKTPVNEYVMGRSVNVKAPLAETTLDNLVATMPGASLVQLGGAYATGTVTIATNPTNNSTIVIGGKTITFKSASPIAANNEVLIGGTVAATAANLGAFINFNADPVLSKLTASVAAAVVTLTYDWKGTAGNAITIATGTAGAAVTVSGATLTGGANGTPARVDVPHGVGVNLLDYAKVLTLHPISKADADKSEDFTVFLAATSGGLNFAYKLEDERIFSVEFNGYPDPTTGRLFAIGDTTAA